MLQKRREHAAGAGPLLAQATKPLVGLLDRSGEGGIDDSRRGQTGDVGQDGLQVLCRHRTFAPAVQNELLQLGARGQPICPEAVEEERLGVSVDGEPGLAQHLVDDPGEAPILVGIARYGERSRRLLAQRPQW